MDGDERMSRTKFLGIAIIVAFTLGSQDTQANKILDILTKKATNELSRLQDLADRVTSETIGEAIQGGEIPESRGRGHKYGHRNRADSPGKGRKRGHRKSEWWAGHGKNGSKHHERVTKHKKHHTKKHRKHHTKKHNKRHR